MKKIIKIREDEEDNKNKINIKNEDEEDNKNKINIKNEDEEDDVKGYENSIEELKFISKTVNEKIFDDFIYSFIIDYRYFKILNMGNLYISQNMNNLKKLFYVKEPEMIVFNKLDEEDKNYFKTPILANYDKYYVKYIILRDILIDNNTKLNLSKTIKVHNEFFNIFTIISFYLKDIYECKTIDEVNKTVGDLFSVYGTCNKDLLDNLDKLKKLHISENNNVIEYSYNYLMEIPNKNSSKNRRKLTLDVKLSYIKFIHKYNNKFEIVDFKTENRFKDKNLEKNLIEDILKDPKYSFANIKKKISFFTISDCENKISLLKNLGFKSIKNMDKNDINNYFRDFSAKEKKIYVNRNTFIFTKKINKNKNKNKIIGSK